MSDTTTPMTPRALRVNLPRDEVRSLLSDIDFARTYHEAEVTLDQLVFELMSGQFFRETT